MAGIIGYVRVSTDEQGLSMEAQEAAIHRYAEFKGYTVLDIVRDEGVSGGTALSDRPGGKRLLELTKKRRGAVSTGVVAAKLDRLFRSALDCLECVEGWQASGTALHLLDMNLDTSTPMGKCFLTNVAAFAEMERALIRERTCTALAQKRARGEFTGGHPPVGTRLAADGVHLEPNEDELRVARRAKALRADDRSYAWVANRLRMEGYKPRDGVYNAEMVARLCEVA